MGRIRRILFPTKFEELSLPAVRDLYALKRAGLEEFVFLSVLDRDEVGFIPFGGFDRDLAEELREEARLRFSDWAAEVEAEGLRCRTFIEVGRPAAKILEVAHREDVDLVVAGRQRRMLPGSVHVGATTLEVLRRSTAPVLVAKARPAEGPGAAADPFQRVLYATDFSPRAARAADFLRAAAGAVRHVTAANVLPESEFRRHTAEEIAVEEDASRAELREVCERLRTAGLEADWSLRAGSVVKELLGVADDEACTSIVLGSGGRGALAEFWLGSTSHRVAELTPLPVVIVPSGDSP